MSTPCPRLPADNYRIGELADGNPMTPSLPTDKQQINELADGNPMTPSLSADNYRRSDKDFDFLTWQEVIPFANIIINSSANSKQEHAL